MIKYPINIVLEDIRSALNVGAIFRTCDAGNINKLYLTGITPYPPHNRIPKTALGAIDYVTWEYNRDKRIVIETLKQAGNFIYAVELAREAKDIFQTEIKFPACFIFGNEINGVNKDTIDLCDKTVYIPMYGTKESLNVATTCGIVIYEAIRKYNAANING